MMIADVPDVLNYPFLQLYGFLVHDQKVSIYLASVDCITPSFVQLAKNQSWNLQLTPRMIKLEVNIPNTFPNPSFLQLNAILMHGEKIVIKKCLSILQA